LVKTISSRHDGFFEGVGVTVLETVAEAVAEIGTGVPMTVGTEVTVELAVRVIDTTLVDVIVRLPLKLLAIGEGLEVTDGT